MPKINREEYEVLKELDDKWNWIARDEDRCLYAITEKPVRKDGQISYWGTETEDPYASIELFDEKHLFQFIQWSNSEPYNIAELIEEYETNEFYGYIGWKYAESEETEMKKDIEWLKNEINELPLSFLGFSMLKQRGEFAVNKDDVLELIDQLDEPEQPKITLQDVADKLWELPSNNRKLWLARLNDEFQEGYIVPLGLKTTDGEEQYLTYNGSYFASRRNKHLQQTFDTLEEIPEFYRDLAERVI